MLSASCTINTTSSASDDFFVDSIAIDHGNDDERTTTTNGRMTVSTGNSGNAGGGDCHSHSDGSGSGSGSGRKQAKKLILILIVVLCLVAIPTLLYFFVLDDININGLKRFPDEDDVNNNNNNDADDANKPKIIITQEERQLYYNRLMSDILPPDTFPIETGSPKARALEWLAFQDEDADLIHMTINHNHDDDDEDEEDYIYIEQRVSQRYALLVLYFALGGPQLWNVINQDTSAGWIEYGSGVHECSWKGIDCSNSILNSNVEEKEEGEGDVSPSQKPAEIITGLRLSGGFGITLTGTSLPNEIKLLTNLQVLDFENNRLQGTIPKEWKTLSNLVLLNLGNNHLDSVIPSWIGDLSQLRALHLATNSFSGSLPTEILNLEPLERLDVQGNPTLQGSITEILVSLPNLVYLDVSGTGITGSLPTDLSPPPNSQLHVLRAFPASITGTIPTEIGSWWKNLNELEIGSSTMSMTGSLPTEIGLLANLSLLRLRRNYAMTGTLPTELGLLNHLEILDLAQTNRHGTLPKEYSHLTNLKEFDVYENPISGTIPEEYAAMTNLKYGWFQHTSLSGTVPSSLCDLNVILEADCWILDIPSPPPPAIECGCCICYLPP